ncbi:MAG TPA: hypothetical protein VMT85_04465 [Thermoanaerobaculia bacterium]|nr:hypothetical protein [Thermoanaerobaculia bacterium]
MTGGRDAAVGGDREMELLVPAPVAAGVDLLEQKEPVFAVAGDDGGDRPTLVA